MRSTAVTLAGAVAFVAMLAACGSSSHPSASGNTTAGGSGAPASVTTARTGSASGAGTCKQITRSQVQPLIDAPITDEKVTPTGPNNSGQQCVFAISDNSDAMTIIVVRDKNAAQAAFADDSARLGHAVDLPGIGDHAVRDADHDTGEVSAIEGDTYCQVNPQNDEVPGVGKLMEAAGNTNNIGDAAFATIASAVGTLCNRIFGNGNTTPDLSSIASAAASATPSTGSTLTVPPFPPTT